MNAIEDETGLWAAPRPGHEMKEFQTIFMIAPLTKEDNKQQNRNDDDDDDDDDEGNS